jgi:hypothetical protein
MADVAVIGAQKCGLCSTRTWLKNFPELEVYPWEWHGWTWDPERKEEAAASSEWREVLASPASDKGASNLIRDFLRAQGTLSPWSGPADRLATLGGRRRQRVLVTPGLSMMDTKINARILSAVNEDMKVLMLVRDPIDRAYISWNQFNKAFADRPEMQDNRTFEEAIEQGLHDRKDPNYSFIRPYWDQYVAAGEYGRIQRDFKAAGLEVHWVSLDAIATDKAVGSAILRDLFGLEVPDPPPFPHVHAENPEVPLDRRSATALRLLDYYRAGPPPTQDMGGFDGIYGFSFDYMGSRSEAGA